MFRIVTNFPIPCSALVCFLVLACGRVLLQTQSATANPAVQETEKPRPVTNYWSKEKQADYSQRISDANTWNMRALQEDLESLKSNPWPTKTALSNFPSPVPKYSGFGGAMAGRSFRIGKRQIKGTLVSWGKHDVNQHLAAEKSHDEIAYFNIFILTDMPDPEHGAKHLVSRNFPHILSTGKQKTTVGDVDWLHAGLADGSNYAFINQRIFDLNFGKTILVAPQTDGSLRFMQMKSPASYARNDAGAFLDGVASMIEDDPQAIDFFANVKAIGGN